MNQPAGGGMIFFLIWLVTMLFGLVSWIITVMAIWRAMKAHESIADSLKQISTNQRQQDESQG